MAAQAISLQYTNATEQNASEEMQEEKEKTCFLETFILLDFSLCQRDSYLLVLSPKHLAQAGTEEVKAERE